MAFQPPLPIRRPLPSHSTQPVVPPPPKLSLKDLPELSKPLPTPATPLPHPASTIYHLLPSPVPHLPRPEHPNDNDPALLAVSLRTPWLRARHPRTKPLQREARAQRRLYRGPHGALAQRGADASAKPKNLPTCVAAFRGWVVVAGSALPYKIAPRDLVTFGNTALGDVLSEELVDSRGTGVVRVARYARTPWVCALARNPAGSVLRSHVVECGETTRNVAVLKRVQACDMSVSENFVCVVEWSVESGGGVKGLFTGLFGGSERLDIDISKGCVVHVLRKDGSTVAKVPVEGLLSGLQVEESADRVRVTAKRVRAERISVTTVEDIRSGEAFKQDGIESRMVQIDIGENDVGEVVTLGRENVAVMDVAKVYDGDLPCNPVHIGFNKATSRVGLWDLQGRHWETDPGNRLSGALLSPGHTHVSVLQTGSTPPKLLFFAEDLSEGPVCEIPLEGVEDVHASIDGVWSDFDYEWSEENAKIVKSAYELFAEKDWNDIESGFSSLGVRL